MKVLHLTLNKKWFDMILSGEKKEEYREIKPYWRTRLKNTEGIGIIRFRNGYKPDSPTFDIELKSISIGKGNPDWGAPSNDVYRLHLGNFITP